MHSKISNSDSSSPPSAKKEPTPWPGVRPAPHPSPDVTLTTGTCGYLRCTGSAVYFATRNLPMRLHNATSVGDRGSQTRCAHRRRRLFFSHAPVPGASSFLNGKSVSALEPGLTRSLRLTTIGMVETSRRALPCSRSVGTFSTTQPMGRKGTMVGRDGVGAAWAGKSHVAHIART